MRNCRCCLRGAGESGWPQQARAPCLSLSAGGPSHPSHQPGGSGGGSCPRGSQRGRAGELGLCWGRGRAPVAGGASRYHLAPPRCPALLVPEHLRSNPTWLGHSGDTAEIQRPLQTSLRQFCTFHLLLLFLRLQDYLLYVATSIYIFLLCPCYLPSFPV